MTSVLVSGAAPQVTSVAAALRGRSVDVVEVTDLADMAIVCGDAGADAFDGYVQLPVSYQMWGETVVERVHNFYAGGVLARFTAMWAAIPTLRARARVTFVLGHLPAEVDSPEDHDARESLTRILAHAARADAPQAGLSLRILQSDATVDSIVAATLGLDSSSQQLLEELSTLDYADWRVEVLGLAALDT